MITRIRLISQQLADPVFDNPKELVGWMGAIQAQQYEMAKWAIGIRLKTPSLAAVDEALEKGEIVRTHVMRPTWHIVAAEDLRWMLKLSEHRVRSANDSLANSCKLGLTESFYNRCHGLLEKMLEGCRYLTKQEIGTNLSNAGIPSAPPYLNRILLRAETDGILCSGPDKNRKPTYALLEERIPPAPRLHKDEALFRLAVHYFRSHSPASADDFAWWSGLTTTDAKKAIALAANELDTDRSVYGTLYMHTSCNKGTKPDDILHFLPSYDEYLISYKDRSAVLDPVHYPKAFNRYGIFYPVILHNGNIVGNWNKKAGKKPGDFEITLFKPDLTLSSRLTEKAANRYRAFVS